MFAGLFLQAALFTGCFFLSFDLQRGIARALLTLPMTAKQIGRAAWFASVLIPSLALALTLALGVTIGAVVKGQGLEHPGIYLFSSLLGFVWQGTGFFLLSEMNPANIRSVRGIIASSFWGLSVGGCFWLSRVVLTGSHSFILLGGMVVAALLTMLGWFRAEDLILQRGAFRMGAMPKNSKPGQFRAPSGFGGLAYIWQTLIVRVCWMSLVMLAFMLILPIAKTTDIPLSLTGWIKAVLIPCNSFMWMFAYLWLLMPLMMNLRVLRTLPVSTGALAATLIGLPMSVNLGWAGLLALVTSDSHLFLIALPVAGILGLTIPFVLRSGFGQGFLVAAIFIMTAGAMAVNFTHIGNYPAVILVTVSLLLIGFAWWLTCRQLRSTSRAYQFRLPTSYGGWGASQ
jgi:hypothetical protein